MEVRTQIKAILPPRGNLPCQISKSGKSRYTRLFASISDEEDCYTVQVRLSNERKPEDSAWGEEIVDLFETASELVATLAGEFSIVQACIKIEIRMHNHKHGTRH
jgi:hypothetical protein